MELLKILITTIIASTLRSQSLGAPMYSTPSTLQSLVTYLIPQKTTNATQEVWKSKMIKYFFQKISVFFGNCAKVFPTNVVKKQQEWRNRQAKKISCIFTPQKAKERSYGIANKDWIGLFLFLFVVAVRTWPENYLNGLCHTICYLFKKRKIFWHQFYSKKMVQFYYRRLCLGIKTVSSRLLQ